MILSVCIFAAVCTVAVCVLIYRAPVIEDFEPSRVEQILIAARHHRDSLDAIEAELLELHCVTDRESREATWLAACVWSGADYADAVPKVK